MCPCCAPIMLMMSLCTAAAHIMHPYSDLIKAPTTLCIAQNGGCTQACQDSHMWHPLETKRVSTVTLVHSRRPYCALLCTSIVVAAQAQNGVTGVLNMYQWKTEEDWRPVFPSQQSWPHNFSFYVGFLSNLFELKTKFCIIVYTKRFHIIKTIKQLTYH